MVWTNSELETLSIQHQLLSSHCFESQDSPFIKLYDRLHVYFLMDYFAFDETLKEIIRLGSPPATLNQGKDLSPHIRKNYFVFYDLYTKGQKIWTSIMYRYACLNSASQPNTQPGYSPRASPSAHPHTQ